MNHILRPALVLTLGFTALTGALYPLAVAGVAQALFPQQAHGSLVEREGRVIGSGLIAQGFTSDRYFHPRPSAAGQGYDASASSGSNLGPTSKALIAAVGERTAALQKENPDQATVPLDLVTTSGSGLDPHLSPAGAQYQVARVAKSRGLTAAQVQHEVDALTESRALGVFGEKRVNVLRLNLALDALAAPARAP